MSTSRDWLGKTAFVTGGTDGIGLAVAQRFAEAGANVMATSIDVQRGEALVRWASERGLAIAFERADVRRRDEVSLVVDAAMKRFGGIDALVNNAGVFQTGAVTDLDEVDWHRVIDVNLTGTFLVSRAVIPALKRRGGGAIVNLASASAHAARAGMAAYAASKGGVLALTRAMAVDHAPDRIRVNCVSPGTIDTPFVRRAWEDLLPADAVDDKLRNIGAAHLAGRLGTADEVAEVIVFLAGPGASFVTGADWKVDGGLLAQVPIRVDADMHKHRPAA